MWNISQDLAEVSREADFYKKYFYKNIIGKE